MRKPKLRQAHKVLSVLLAVLLLPPALLADRTRLKPGMNLFSEKQDIEFGQQAAREAEQQLPLLNARQVNDYLNRLGQRLARRAPGYQYPYQFKAVNQKEVNAFALPGGFMYVNRGTIEIAENEAQLAGVMAHEISHVALRHGTNQLTKAYLAQAPLGILGALLGGGGVASQLAQLGIQVGFTGVFLKFSRDAERQADLMGAQILYDAGYDPRAMADFFDTLNNQSKGGRPIEFFSSHPNPEKRREKIEREIEKLGSKEDLRTDSEEFQAVRRFVQQLPAPPKAGEGRRSQNREQDERLERLEQRPSRRFAGYRHSDFAISYPDNWEVVERGPSSVLFAPRGGFGEAAIAYGVLADVLEIPDSQMPLEEATDRLVNQILQDNAGMRRVSRERARVGGQRALATQLEGPSPVRGQQETDWLFTVRTQRGLFYALFIVPESDYRAYQRTFQEMLDSVRFR